MAFNRFVFRALIIYPFAFMALAAVSILTDSALGGQIMFVGVVAVPILLLASAAASSVFGERVATAETKPAPSQSQNSLRNCFLFGGIYGLFMLVALMVFASLTEARPNTWEKLGFAAFAMATPVATTIYFFILPWLRRRRLYLQGLNLVQAGDRLAAQALYFEAINKNPNNNFAWQLAAQGHLELGQYRDALICAQRAVELERNAFTLAGRGLALAMLSANEDALTDLQAAYKLFSLPPVRTVMCMALVRLRRLDAALACLPQAKSRGDILAMTYLASAQSLSGLPEAAAITCRAIIDASPNDPDLITRGLVAHAKLGLGELDDARDLSLAILSEKPGHLNALLALFYVYATRSEVEDAWRTAFATALVNPTEILYSLQEPEVSSLMSDARFRELFVACRRLQQDQVEWARSVISRPPPDRPVDEHRQQGPNTPPPGPTPLAPEETWGSA